MSKMAAFNLLAAAALLCCIGCCTAQHGRPNEKYTYIGCYGDTTRRDLSSYVAHSRMSVEFCYRQCDRLRYRYFGLQNGRLCFCGNTYGLACTGARASASATGAATATGTSSAAAGCATASTRSTGSSASATASRTPETQTTDGAPANQLARHLKLL
uniref:WSC domain-containing protein n=1 Tax=Macrostomum lignano TaxID=282301 RepID=A0A1I8FQH3_9PLAT